MAVSLEANLSGVGYIFDVMDKPKVPTIASPAKFVKEVIAELKKTTWPTRQETIKLTAIVIAISIVVGAFIGILDTTFLRISGLLFRK